MTTPQEHGEKTKRLAWDARQAMLDYGKARVDGDDAAIQDSTTRACGAIEALAQRCAEAERRLREVEADAAKLRALLFSVRSEIVHRPTMAVYLVPAIDQAMKNGGQQ